MTGPKIGYARISTTNQDLTAQRDGFAALGVDADLVYVDHGPDRHPYRHTLVVTGS